MPPSSNREPQSSELTLGLYLHIPFCLRKCPYCSFVSGPVDRDLMHRYARALQSRIRRMANPEWTEGRQITTLFFGGGTPSILPAAVLADILRECRKYFALTGKDTECSIEVNPATINKADLQELVRCGFNRISLGVQSFDDTELQQLGRPHNAADAEAVLQNARRAGFDNISIDLMYGLPGQTVSDWRRSLETALEFRPEHLSMYELTIEEGTPYAQLQDQGKLILPAENEVLKMMDLTAELTGRAGFHRYEISNYARPGRECRHNINYWRNGSYLGLGAAAVSFLGGRRYSAVADTAAYCARVEAGREPWSEVEELGREPGFRETVIMGLRMTRGVVLSDLEQRFGLDPVSYYGRTLQMLEENGLLVREGNSLRLTDRGLNLANRVMAELV